MILHAHTPAAPPRELEEAMLTHGGHLLRLTVLRQVGTKLRRHTTVYAVEAVPGIVRLVKEDGAVWTCTEFWVQLSRRAVQGQGKRVQALDFV